MDSPRNLKVLKRTVTSIKYEWPINFDCCTCTATKGYFSPIFPLESTLVETVQWRMKINLTEHSSSYCMQLGLYALSKRIFTLDASYAFVVKWDGENEIVRRIQTYNFDADTIAAGWKQIGSCEVRPPELPIIRMGQKSLPKIILCTIDMVDEQREAPVTSLYFKTPNCCLKQNIESLLTTGKDADITLVSKDNVQKINAHKVILMARSPVFYAMFNNEMSESRDKLVVLDDLEGEVLDELVRYIYTGRVSNLSATANQLLQAADKYDLPTLRGICEQEMANNLSVENAAQTLVLADLHQASQLKKYTLEFIKHHAQKVLATDGWQEIKTRYPSLGFDLCESFAAPQPFNSR